MGADKNIEKTKTKLSNLFNTTVVITNLKNTEHKRIFLSFVATTHHQVAGSMIKCTIPYCKVIDAIGRASKTQDTHSNKVAGFLNCLYQKIKECCKCRDMRYA